MRPIFSRIPDENPELLGYVTAEVQNCVETGKLVVTEKSLITTIIQVLELGAQGMYLWVSLLITTLCGLSSDYEILPALENLPVGLPATYSRLLEKHTSSSKKDKESILQLMIAALRPLSAVEIQEALIVEPGKLVLQTTRLSNSICVLLGCCGGLVSMDEEELTILFAHDSVRQFLLDTNHRYGFTLTDAETRMAQVITTYLNIEILDTRLTHTVIPKIHAQALIDEVIKSNDDNSSAVKLSVDFFDILIRLDNMISLVCLHNPARVFLQKQVWHLKVIRGSTGSSIALHIWTKPFLPSAL